MSERWQMTLRPALSADHAAIVAVFQAEDMHFRGHTDYSAEMLQAQLAKTTFDPERDLVVAERDGQVIAAALVTNRNAHLGVHPAADSPALWADLLAWSEARQTALGRTPLRIGIPHATTTGTAALELGGYRVERFYTLMVRTFAVTGPPESALVHDGYRIRPVDAVADASTLYALNERAFAGRPDHEVQGETEWVRAHLAFSEFEPAWSLLAQTSDGAPAASLIGFRPTDHPHGHVALLGTDPDHRRRGLGRALLLHAFAIIHAEGLATAELHVASDNPRALDLYTGVGMEQSDRFDSYARTP